MTQTDRQAYSALSIRQQRRIEARFARPVYVALRITVNDFVADAKARGLTAATGTLYTVISNDQLAQVMRDIHEQSGLFFGRKAWREINRTARAPVEKAGFSLNLKWINDLIAYFTQDLFMMVQRITETTRQQILAVLSKAEQQGRSFEWITNQLESPDLLRPRARLIARTEVAKGAFAGRKLANQDNEWETVKEWIAANDHRTRHGHRLVDGEIIDTEARFQVQGKKGISMMEGPGDPSAPAEQVCNCRCVAAYRAKRDADGRLIKKQVQFTTNL